MTKECLKCNWYMRGMCVNPASSYYNAEIPCNPSHTYCSKFEQKENDPKQWSRKMTTEEQIHFTLNQILKELKIHHEYYKTVVKDMEDRYKKLEEARQLLDATRKVYDIIVKLDLDKIGQAIEEK